MQTVSFPTSYLKEMGLPYESYEDNLKIIKNQESSPSRWFLKAYDIDKQAERDFAMKDIIGEVR